MIASRTRRTTLLAIAGLVLAMALAPMTPIVADPPPRHAAARRAPTTSRRAPRSRAERRQRFTPRLTAAQRRQIRRWHARAPRGEVARWSARDPLPLVLRPLHGNERFELVPDGPDGTFSAVALGDAERALESRVDGARHAIHPRLLQLLHRAVRHFRAPYAWVISGYRSGNPRSRHAQGRAIDVVLPGVPDRRLAAYLRPQGFVGVGIYPTSGFVHLDVRARSYFWSDRSGPDQQNRERRMYPSLGPRFDRIARNLGAEPVPDLDATSEEETGESSPALLEEGDLDPGAAAAPDAAAPSPIDAGSAAGS